MWTLLAIAGTRPEALKLAPVVRAASQGTTLRARVAFSGQHRELLASVLGDLDLHADYALSWLENGGGLGAKAAILMGELDPILEAMHPDGVFVQGDTLTALAGALVAFYRRIPVFHVEAGLRTSDPTSPFPEEMNRRLVTRLATLHFAPTPRAAENLRREEVPEASIVVCGNTGIDALFFYARQEDPHAAEILGRTGPGRRRVLVTLHRRENFSRVGEATRAIRELTRSRDDVEVLWVLHMNETRATVQRELGDCRHVQLLEPQGYRTFVHLMRESAVVLTDSGGVQEEAPALGKPVLVLRDETERPEAVEAGSSAVVGCHTGRIVAEVNRLLDDPTAYAARAQVRLPFGDGHASETIIRVVDEYLTSVRPAARRRRPPPSPPRRLRPPKVKKGRISPRMR